MSLEERWADVLGDETLHPVEQDAFYHHLAAVVAVLQHDAPKHLMESDRFARWMQQTHDAESVWLAAHDVALNDPVPEAWHRVVSHLPLLERAHLSSLRPYSKNAADYYRFYCDERADEIDCNDLFHETSASDRANALHEVFARPTPTAAPALEPVSVEIKPRRQALAA